MALTLRSAARSDVGLVRASNQDSGYAGRRFVVVADGMGGHAGGDVASAITVAELVGLDVGEPSRDAAGDLRRAVARAQEALLRRVEREPALAGMGTTLTALLRDGDQLVVAHLGDSRGYLLREGVLTQVTHDHTFVQRLVDDGRITPEEAERHPQRNVILRVLGDVQSSPDPDMAVRPAQAGDRWLLCSDGLPRVVSDETIETTLASVDDPGAAADALVALALRAGAPDNVTCVVADVVDAGGPGGSTDGGPGSAPDDQAAGDGRPGEVVGAAARRRSARTAAVGSPAARAAELVREDRGPRARRGAAAPLAGGASSLAGARGRGGRAPRGDADAEGDPERPPRARLLGPAVGGASAQRLTHPARVDHDLLERDPEHSGEPTDPGDAERADRTDRAEGADGTDRAERADRADRPRRRARRLAVAVVVLVLLAGGAVAATTWLGRQYYVGTSGSRVALYRGLSQDVGPVRLSRLVEREDLTVASLPPVWRQQLRQTIPAVSLADARAKVDQLRQARSDARDGTGTGTGATTTAGTP